METSPSQESLSPPPPITASSSPTYQHKLASITSRATLSDPLNILFQREILASPVPILPSHLYTSTLSRIASKTSLGSCIVEADDFAAVACWEPPAAVHPPHTELELEKLAEGRPIFADFVRKIERARGECLMGEECWQLSLMARDPQRSSKGAVRALLEWGLRRARREGRPVWCVAGNERARDVYAWFGFRIVSVVKSGGEEGVVSWCMVCNWPVEDGRLQA